MSRMVSRWESKYEVQKAEIQGHMFSNGEIRYTMIRSNRNLGWSGYRKRKRANH